MRIGLYGMPTSGKSYIMDRIDFMEVLVGSKLLRQFDPDFDKKDEAGREYDRRKVAEMMMAKKEFIMDGHYAFGKEIAFTEEEGEMYDVYIYLYIDPNVLKERMLASSKNLKYADNDIAAWQKCEIDGLREYCHLHEKDFYVVDNPTDNTYINVDEVIEFIREIRNGYSCVEHAKWIADEILKESFGDTITLMDGDKTLTIEDSSNAVFGYSTHLYDGNFYTGFQSWKQNKEFETYSVPKIYEMPVRINDKVAEAAKENTFILTSGHEKVWRFISEHLGIPYFYGIQMAAETKYFVTFFLQKAGKKVIAYGDGMNDYYMLKQADESYLVSKADGSISRSLKGKDLEGLSIV